MNDSPPDRAEEEAAKELDDAVPSFGYGLLPTVGLGGSTGCLEALQAFFEAAPTKSGMAFVVVLHLPQVGADAGSRAQADANALAQQLGGWTPMAVAVVGSRTRLEPDTVYLLPPGRAPHMRGNFLEPARQPASREGRLPVDLFFRTLADSHGPHGTAVVLCGPDGDGALGIKRVKERGGLTVAQDPREAADASMAQAAVATGMIDWVLPAREIAARIEAYYRIEAQLRLPAEARGAEGAPPAGSDEAALREVLAFVRNRTGRDFDDYKRVTVLRRLGRRMQVNGVRDLAAYLECLRTRPGEAGALLHDMLISVTNFFRDADCFAGLADRVPELFRGKGQGDTLRVWVVACATGEEAYSIAMLLAEHARLLEHPPAIQVFATDLDEDAVRTAREGIYSPAAEADLGEERLRQYFVREPRGLRVRRELREMVLFAVHDVLRDPPFSRIDLASCRNLLIYLNKNAQARVLETLHFSMHPGALLFLGASETVDGRDGLFDVADARHRIFLQRSTPGAGIALPRKTAGTPRVRDARHAATVIPQVAVAPPRPPPAALPAPGGRRSVTWGELHLQLLDLVAPPSILVNADHEMLHISPAATAFLYFGGGEPSRNVLRAIVPELRAELRTALHHAGAREAPVEVAPVRVRIDHVLCEVAIGVRSVPALGSFLVLLHSAQVQGEGAAGGGRPVGSAHGNAQGNAGATQQPRVDAASAEVTRVATEPVADHLAREVDRLKARLRQTVEQYEISAEELRAGNEELHAMNEELHAAAEELDASREELQSINEELVTVNQELKTKVDDLGHANSDMMNLMDATAIATVFLDRELCVTRFTPSATAIFKLISSDLGRPLSDIAARMDYPQLVQDARTVLRSLLPSEREVSGAQGAWYLARVRPYRTIEDVIAGVVLTFVDISDRKAAQESLRRTQERFSAIVNQASVGVAQMRLDGGITFANSFYCKLMGYEGEELVGLSALDLVHPGDRAAARQLFGQLAAHGTSFQTETRTLRKDGGVIWLHKSATVLTDGEARPDSALVVCIDVSERKFAEEALRESREHLRLMLENALDYAIFSVDMERRVTSWNAGAERLLGYSEQEILGRSADVIFTEDDRAADAPGHEARTALAEGRASDDRVHQRKDGSRFWASGALMPMNNAEGAVVGLVKVLRDQSVQRAAQQELEHSRGELLGALRANEAARRALEAADAAKDRFLAVLSHELRNPLASISGAAELLAPESLATPELAHAARVIRRQASAMKVMLAELLDVSSLRQGRLALKPERISAQAIADAALEAVRPLIEQGGHALELQIADAEIALDADPVRLSQVLSNLLGNAARYTPAGGCISLSLRADGREAIFEVVDDGIGMDPDMIETMFQMFVQSERAHTHSHVPESQGIGLALARNIVELHGGTVTGQSEGPGRGCRFTVRLPRAQPRDAASPLAAQDTAAQPARLTRLLLADDNADALWGMGQMLSKAGFEVETVHNGVDALRVARDTKPDAAVLDIGMPGLDGHEVARRIRAEAWGRDMVLIAATGWGQSADRSAALAAGFDDHVAKPVTAADLQRLLRAREADRRPAAGG